MAASRDVSAAAMISDGWVGALKNHMFKPKMQISKKNYSLAIGWDNYFQNVFAQDGNYFENIFPKDVARL